MQFFFFFHHSFYLYFTPSRLFLRITSPILFFLLFQLIQNHKYCSHFLFQMYSFSSSSFFVILCVFRRSVPCIYLVVKIKKESQCLFLSILFYLSHINQTLEICNTFCLSFAKHISFCSPQSITWS